MSETLKTILIPIHDGTITKNLLRTDFLQCLVRSGQVRVVLLLQKADADAYEKEFGVPDKVIVEHTNVYHKQDKIELLFSSLYKHSIPTTFMKIRQADWYWNKGKYGLYIGASTLRFLGQFRFWQKVLLLINNVEPIDAKVRAVYEKWKPDMVFAPTMMSRVEVALMRLARTDKKLVVGMAKSFDNLTSKSYLRVHPDWLIVPNDTSIEEAVSLYGYPRERTIATGICQYDAYVDKSILEDRTLFFSKLGLNPTKKTILYAPAGDWMNPSDHEVLAGILKWTEDGTLPNTQVLLRLHPTYESQTEKLDGHPNLVVERPGKHHGNLKWYEFEKDDIQHLASSLAYSDVVINTGSTLMVESAIFDTPVIALGFDGNTKKNYWRSVIRYYDREHLVPIMSTGGVELAISFENLKSAIVKYIENPNLDFEGRKEVVTRICYKMDGKGSERTARVVLDALNG